MREVDFWETEDYEEYLSICEKKLGHKIFEDFDDSINYAINLDDLQTIVNEWIERVQESLLEVQKLTFLLNRGEINTLKAEVT